MPRKSGFDSRFQKRGQTEDNLPAGARHRMDRIASPSAEKPFHSRPTPNANGHMVETLLSQRTALATGDSNTREAYLRRQSATMFSAIASRHAAVAIRFLQLLSKVWASPRLAVLDLDAD